MAYHAHAPPEQVQQDFWDSQLWAKWAAERPCSVLRTNPTAWNCPSPESRRRPSSQLGANRLPSGKNLVSHWAEVKNQGPYPTDWQKSVLDEESSILHSFLRSAPEVFTVFLFPAGFCKQGRKFFPMKMTHPGVPCSWSRKGRDSSYSYDICCKGAYWHHVCECVRVCVCAHVHICASLNEHKSCSANGVSSFQPYAFTHSKWWCFSTEYDFPSAKTPAYCDFYKTNFSTHIVCNGAWEWEWAFAGSMRHAYEETVLRKESTSETQRPLKGCHCTWLLLHSPLLVSSFSGTLKS